MRAEKPERNDGRLLSFFNHADPEVILVGIEDAHQPTWNGFTNLEREGHMPHRTPQIQLHTGVQAQLVISIRYNHHVNAKRSLITVLEIVAQHFANSVAGSFKQLGRITGDAGRDKSQARKEDGMSLMSVSTVLDAPAATESPVLLWP